MTDLVTQSIAWVRSPSYVDLTTRQIAVLGVLCDAPGPHRVRDVAESLQVSKPVVTRAITKLAIAGLVLRTVDIEDRRDRLLAASSKGRGLRAELADV